MAFGHSMILHARSQQKLEILPFYLDQLSIASYNVRLGAKLLIPKFPYPYPEDPDDILVQYEEVTLAKDESFLLDAGASILAETEEFIKLDRDILARIEGKSTVGRHFVTSHVTAGFVDPGFKGFLTLEIVNLSPDVPYKLKRGQLIGQLSFDRVDHSPFLEYHVPELFEYHGRYQNSYGVRPPAGHD